MPSDREKRLAAKAVYRQKNHKELAEKQRAYHAAQRDECNERNLARQQANPERRKHYREQNKEQITKKAREWETANREHRLALRRAWHAANKGKATVYHDANREKILARKRAYNAANKDKIRAYYTRPDVRERALARDKAWSAANPERLREYRRGAEARRRTAQEATAGRPRPEGCEICGGTNKNGKALQFDHCHRQGHFRGWLCSRCNLTLGRVDDNPQLLRQLAAYLERAG